MNVSVLGLAYAKLCEQTQPELHPQHKIDIWWERATETKKREKETDQKQDQEEP